MKRKYKIQCQSGPAWKHYSSFQYLASARIQIVYCRASYPADHFRIYDAEKGREIV